MSNKVHKLVEKKHIGYRYVSNDKVIFETNNEHGSITIDDLEQVIRLDLTPQNITMIYEFFRYLKSDLDGN